jgi:hypothetical protein
MDAVVFLCVSLDTCSSIVQLPDSLNKRHACSCSEAGFSSQNGDRAGGVYHRGATFSCAYLLWAKNSIQRIFINKYFMFTMGSVYRVKRFTTGSRNVANISLMTKRLQRRRLSRWKKSQKRFRRTDTAMGQVYQCWWRICREINVFFFFSISNITCFTFHIQTLSYVSYCDSSMT